MKSMVLALLEIKTKHAAQAISYMVSNALSRLLRRDTLRNSSHKITAISDGAANMLKACVELKLANVIQDSHRCIAHQLHVAISKSLPLDLLSRIRAAFGSIRKKQSLLRTFANVQKLNEDTAAVLSAAIDRIRVEERNRRDIDGDEEDSDSADDDEEEVDEQKRGRFKAPVRDVPTRWTSSHLLLQCFYDCRQALVLEGFSFDVEDFDGVSELLPLLQHCVSVLTSLEGQNSPTFSRIYPYVYGLERNLRTLEPKHAIALAFRNKMMAHLEEGFQAIHNPGVVHVAAVLHPGFKAIYKNLQPNLKQYVESYIQERIESVPNCEPEKKARYSTAFADLLPVEGSESVETDEWQRYVSALSLPAEVEVDPLKWWATHHASYPKLAKLARQLLAVPASSAACERIFSVANSFCNKSRSNLRAETVEALILLRHNWELVERKPDYYANAVQ